MKLLTAEQFRMADVNTIKNEPISSVDLMERAAKSCCQELTKNVDEKDELCILCGPGNNGGDGLAIARILADSGKKVTVILTGNSDKLSPDAATNFQKLQKTSAKFLYLTDADLPLANTTVWVDAIFGSGLNKAVEKNIADLIHKVNATGAPVFSIDLPTGLFADKHTPSDDAVIHASTTLTFQRPKRCMLYAENAHRNGEVKVLDIGLDERYIESLNSAHELVDRCMIKKLLKPRKRFSHKGNFGHALLIGGSYGKAGAIALSAKACVKSGAGLTTVHTIKTTGLALQSSIPEVMLSTCEGDKVSDLPDLKPYSAIASGPGLGIYEETTNMIGHLLVKANSPLVLDADALNIISENKKLLNLIPENTIITPHKKEFERLFGVFENDFQRNDFQIAASVKHKIVIVLKGVYTSISTPDGRCFFNTTGNAGLAKGGSGDTLTGIVAAMLAQGLTAADAAIAAVFIHGLAADCAVKKIHPYALTASDVTEYLSEAFMQTV